MTMAMNEPANESVDHIARERIGNKLSDLASRAHSLGEAHCPVLVRATVLAIQHGIDHDVDAWTPAWIAEVERALDEALAMVAARAA